MIKKSEILKKIILSLSGSFLIWLLIPQNIKAAGLVVSPANVYLQISGGETEILNYLLTNKSDQELQVSLEPQSFKPDENFGQPILTGKLDFPYLNLFEGTSEAQSAILLQPGEKKVVSVQVAPPLGVTEKEYPLTLLFTAASKQPSPSSSAVSFQVGSNAVILTDQSNLDKSQLEIVSPKFERLTDSFINNKKSLKIVNHGPTGTLIQGTLILKRKNGEIVKSWDFYPDLVLGESSRMARGKTPPDGNGNVSLITEFQLPRPLIGEYILEGQIVSGHPLANSPETTFKVEFLALPYIVLAVIIMIAFSFLLIKLKSRKNSKKLSQKALNKRVVQMKDQKDYFR